MMNTDRTRLLLSDWAAFGRTIPRRSQRLLTELLLLSLVYDEILIQDETLVLNHTFADQFASQETFRVIEQLIESNVLVILTHPRNLYPDAAMKERAPGSPMETRAEYISRYGTSGDTPFTPTVRQQALYKRLDACLLRNPRSHRSVSLQTIGGRNIMEVFKELMYLVLSDQESYGRWLRSAFRGISDEMRTEFIRCIEDPSRALTRIISHRGEIRSVLQPDGVPVFNRSLAYQLSATYGSLGMGAMQRLIQTLFAAPFSYRECATGRYNSLLREFLLVPDTVDHPTPAMHHVSLVADLSTKIVLPPIRRDFCDAIHAVRKCHAGIKLRSAMRNAGKDVDLANLHTCWSDVAQELANNFNHGTPVTVRNILCSFGESLAAATISELIDKSCLHSEMNAMLLDACISLTGAGLVMGGSLIVKSLRNDLRRQRLRGNIESALSVRCSDIAIPQALIGSS
jgi:hypothetical protein